MADRLTLALAIAAVLAGSLALASQRTSACPRTAPLATASAQLQSTFNLTIRPGSAGGRMGPDGKRHDAVSPCDLTVPAGREITLRIANYDMMEHSITQPELGLDVVAKPAMMAGPKALPAVTIATFAVPKTGRYRWFCTKPCDTDAGGWAMTPAPSGQPDAGQPARTGYMAGWFEAR